MDEETKKLVEATRKRMRLDKILHSPNFWIMIVGGAGLLAMLFFLSSIWVVKGWSAVVEALTGDLAMLYYVIIVMGIGAGLSLYITIKGRKE